LKNDLIIAFVILVLTAVVWGIAHYEITPLEDSGIDIIRNYPYVRWGH